MYVFVLKKDFIGIPIIILSIYPNMNSVPIA